MMASKLEDLCELKEDYDKKAEKYLLARKMNGEYLRFTEIRITSKIQDENVDMPINGDLFRKIMDLVLNYYKGDLKKIEKKIKNITDCLVIESARKESEKKITVKELVELIKQSFNILPTDEWEGRTLFIFKREQHPINEVISGIYRIIYEKGDIENGKCVITEISHSYMEIAVFEKASHALDEFEKRDCRWYTLNQDDID